MAQGALNAMFLEIHKNQGEPDNERQAGRNARRADYSAHSASGQDTVNEPDRRSFAGSK